MIDVAELPPGLYKRSAWIGRQSREPAQKQRNYKTNSPEHGDISSPSFSSTSANITVTVAAIAVRKSCRSGSNIQISPASRLLYEELSRGCKSNPEQAFHRTLSQLERAQRIRKGATAAAPVGRQDFLIPRAGNQLLRSRAGSLSIYSRVDGSAKGLK